MDRARRSAALATLLVFGISAIALASSGAPASQAASSVAWPISTGLLLAEVVTGGASASDEYVEITNGGSVDADLGGIELVYITSSGAAVTRKATWSSPRPLGPGQHLLVANVLGVYAPTADASYSGGLAATGGALALRVVGGAPIDALGWGDATNGFVEGTAAPAPAARSSIERKPGGIGGNVIDTNDNAPDWLTTTIVSTPNGTTSRALVVADLAHVIWAVNLGCLGFHSWPVRIDDLEHPDELRIDLRVVTLSGAVDRSFCFAFSGTLNNARALA